MPTKTEPTRRRALAMAIAGDPRFTYEIAAAARVNPTLFGRIVKGTQDPSPEMKERIAAALNTSVDELFEDDA